MKLRPRKVPLLIATVLVLALGLGVWVIHYRGKRAVADYKKQLVAAGEKLTVDELIPKPVAWDQNSANIFLKAVALMNVREGLLGSNPPPAMRMVATGKAMIGWAQPDIRDYYAGPTTNTWAEADAAIAEISEALELLQQMIEHPALDFSLDYQQGFSLPLPNLAQTKKAAQRLSAAAICDLHRGDAASATMHVRAMLALSKGLADERLVISQLVRIAIAAITVTANWELLQSPNITDDQLAALQRDWMEMDFVPAVENSLEMDRAMGEMTVAQMRNSGTEFRRFASGAAFGFGGGGTTGASGNWLDDAEQLAKDFWGKTKMKTKETAWRVAWSYSDQLRSLKGRQVLLESARHARTNGSFNVAIHLQQSRLDALRIPRAADDTFGLSPGDLDLRSLLSRSVVFLQRVLNRVMAIEVSRQETITAIALKRYHLRHGNYPPTLEALVPEFFSTVPRDPVDGQPLRYRANDEGTFLLYSVGADGEDNGGNPKPADEKSESRQWQRGRDWVWPQPASLKEIETYFESLRKKNRAEVESGNSTNVLAEKRAFMERYGLGATNSVNVPPTAPPATNTVQ